jgi:hypothetical protein
VESVVSPLNVIIDFNGEVVIVTGDILPNSCLIVMSNIDVVYTVIVDNKTVVDVSRISCVHREREDCCNSQQGENDCDNSFHGFYHLSEIL